MLGVSESRRVWACHFVCYVACAAFYHKSTKLFFWLGGSVGASPSQWHCQWGSAQWTAVGQCIDLIFIYYTVSLHRILNPPAHTESSEVREDRRPAVMDAHRRSNHAAVRARGICFSEGTAAGSCNRKREKTERTTGRTKTSIRNRNINEIRISDSKVSNRQTRPQAATLVGVVLSVELEPTSLRTGELARPHARQLHTLHQPTDPRADLLHAVLQLASHLVGSPRALPFERRRPGE